MKLYVTHYSPYARMARVMVLEKGLGGRIEEVIARTRQPDSPYYSINPSGRVPYLVRDDGVGMEESLLVCEYLDRLEGSPAFERPSGPEYWETLRLEALGRSLMDGVSVWIRELSRPTEDRSEVIIRHEIARSERLVRAWDQEIASPIMNGPFNYAQLILACALGLEIWNPEFTWRADGTALAAWYDRVAARPSLAATLPPGPLKAR